MTRLILLTLSIFLLLVQTALAGDLVVIVNKENNNNIDRALIQKIYLGTATRWPAGGVVSLLDLPDDSPAAAQFASKVLGKSVGTVKDIWAQNLFTGKATPPKVHGSEDTIRKIVARNKNAIGYIKASSVDNSVKVVLTVP
jgi:ABC-type phosphate transport system substrate-binding protein